MRDPGFLHLVALPWKWLLSQGHSCFKMATLSKFLPTGRMKWGKRTCLLIFNCNRYFYLNRIGQNIAILELRNVFFLPSSHVPAKIRGLLLSSAYLYRLILLCAHLPHSKLCHMALLLVPWTGPAPFQQKAFACILLSGVTILHPQSPPSLSILFLFILHIWIESILPVPTLPPPWGGSRGRNTVRM